MHSGATFFQTRIRRNIRLAEAPSFGQSIFEYAPDSNGAADYQSLAEEVIAQEAAGSQEEMSSQDQASAWETAARAA